MEIIKEAIFIKPSFVHFLPFLKASEYNDWTNYSWSIQFTPKILSIV